MYRIVLAIAFSTLLPRCASRPSAAGLWRHEMEDSVWLLEVFGDRLVFSTLREAGALHEAYIGEATEAGSIRLRPLRFRSPSMVRWDSAGTYRLESRNLVVTLDERDYVFRSMPYFNFGTWTYELTNSENLFWHDGVPEITEPQHTGQP